MIRKLLMMPAVLVLILMAAPARSENLENCERGFTANGAGNPAGAIVYYTQCLETGDLTPVSQALAYFNRGSSYHTEGQYDRAIADYGKSIGFDPKDAGAFNSRGVAYADKGQMDLAIADYGRALELKPDYGDALYNRGNAHEAEDRNDQAIADYDRALKLRPGDILILSNRGNAYVNLGQHERGIADYDRVIAITPDDAIAFSNRGLAYIALGKLDRAISNFDQALRFDPKFAAAFYNRGIAYSRKSELKRALADYDQALKFAPDDAEVMNSRGNAYNDLQKFDRAIAEFDGAIALRPDFADAFNNRGNAYSSKGQADQAIADYGQAIRLDPDDPTAYGNRGLTYAELGQKEKAVRDLKKMYALGDRSEILLSKLKELGAPPAPGTEAGKDSTGQDVAGDEAKDLNKMAGGGDAEAQVALGDLHSYSLAMGWYKRAADAGNADAQFKLAALYRDGQGVPVYPQRSRELLINAAEQGHQEARASLERQGIEPPPIKEKEPEKAPPDVAAEGEEKQAGQEDGEAEQVEAPVEAGPPGLNVRLAGMEDAAGEMEPALVALVERLVAAEYAACASAENGSAYDTYLMGVSAYNIGAGYTAGLGALQAGASLPFMDLVSYPVAPTHYLKIDLPDPAFEPGTGERRFGDTVLQFLAKRNGGWSLVLGCPTAEGQMAKGDAG